MQCYRFTVSIYFRRIFSLFCSFILLSIFSVAQHRLFSLCFRWSPLTKQWISNHFFRFSSYTFVWLLFLFALPTFQICQSIFFAISIAVFFLFGQVFDGVNSNLFRFFCEPNSGMGNFDTWYWLARCLCATYKVCFCWMYQNIVCVHSNTHAHKKRQRFFFSLNYLNQSTFHLITKIKSKKWKNFAKTKSIEWVLLKNKNTRNDSTWKCI